MGLTPLEPESSASANSATTATKWEGMIGPAWKFDNAGWERKVPSVGRHANARR